MGRVPHDRVPIGVHDHCSSTCSNHAMNLGQRRINIANVFQYLRRYDGVKVLLWEGKLRSVSSMEFDPWLVSAMRSSHRKQRLADVYAMDLASRFHGRRDGACQESWAGADIQHPLAQLGVQCAQELGALRHHVRRDVESQQSLCSLFVESQLGHPVSSDPLPPSIPSAVVVTPSIAARYPPAEKPTTPILRGSIRYCAA